MDLQALPDKNSLQDPQQCCSPYVIVWGHYQLDSTCVLLQTPLCSIYNPTIVPWKTGILHLMMKKSASLAESSGLVCRLCGC